MATEPKVLSKLVPAHAINRYLWTRIETNGILSKSNYKVPNSTVTLTPIVPVEEVPELLQVIDSQPGVGSYPFIVYSWSRIDNGQTWWLKTHNIGYSIRSTDDEAMASLLELFEKEFEDQDVAARRVNEYIATLPATSPLRRFRFTHVKIHVLGAQMPAGTDTGMNEALVTIAVSYVESTQ